MCVKACICAAALLNFTALAEPPPRDSINVTLEDGEVPQGPSASDDQAAKHIAKVFSKESQIKVKAAVLKGEADAKRDIRSRHFRLRECGKAVGTREIDPGTRYELDWLGPCDHLDYLFLAEAKAYNDTMLEWYRKHPKRTK